MCCCLSLSKFDLVVSCCIFSIGVCVCLDSSYSCYITCSLTCVSSAERYTETSFSKKRRLILIFIFNLHHHTRETQHTIVVHHHQHHLLHQNPWLN
mmetsp:Transcript_14026/g.18726  ORF Transcript_14026/g.18726 Transcript_14026/m.18726 type:complete len:96 (-) Transcript_14026:306-593(-)